jgi:hypothetical protein
LLLYGLESGQWSQSVLFAQHSTGNRESGGPVWSPNGTQMAFVSEGRLWTVAVDGEGGAIGPPDEIADDQPESPSWEGDSRHIVYQTPKGLRRVLADGSQPDAIALDLTWRPAPPPERVVIHAGHVLDGVLEALHGESDIVVERGIIRSIQAHRGDLHTGTVVDAPGETVMPGWSRCTRTSMRGTAATSAASGSPTGSPACGSRRSIRMSHSSSARPSTRDAGPDRGCSSPATHSTAAASTILAASR